MQANSHKKILVVDDHPIVRQGIKALLAMAPEFSVCGEAESAPAALELLDATHPDLVVVDITLKGADGLELTKSIRARTPETPVLIISMHDESLYAERALRAGANGYIMKQEVSENIVDAIRQILNGQVYVSENVQQRVLMGMQGTIKSGSESPVQRLSDRELEVFRLIGQGIGTRQISETLNLSIKTIETYRAHIKEKLNLKDASELVREAVRWTEQQNQE